MGWSAAREFRACSEPVSLPVAVSARTGREMTQAAKGANNNRTRIPVRLLRNFILLLRSSQQDGRDPGHRATVCPCREEVRTISQTGLFIGAARPKTLDRAVGSYEAMRPEGYAAFVQPAFDLFRRRLEDSGACNHHLKLPTDPYQTHAHALANFANEPH